MMRKFKKVISMLLSIILMLSIPMHSLAAELPMSNTNSEEYPASPTGNFTEISTIGNATYYFQKGNSYTVAIGLYTDIADCSIKYHNSNSVYSALIPIENLNSFLPQTRGSNQLSQFEAIKEAILNDSLPLEEITFKTFNTPATVTRAASDDESKIMTELYNAGWPEAYTNTLRATKSQNGVTAYLYHSLSYRIKNHDYTVIVAKTALSTLMALWGLPKETVLRIANLVCTADGVCQTVSDIIAGKFDVYAYENKNVSINNVQPYQAARTVKWTAVTGGIGAALTLEYDNKHNDFDDNNAILDTGFRNYANM